MPILETGTYCRRGFSGESSPLSISAAGWSLAQNTLEGQIGRGFGVRLTQTPFFRPASRVEVARRANAENFSKRIKNHRTVRFSTGHCWQERLQTVQSKQFVIQSSREAVRSGWPARCHANPFHGVFLRGVDSQPEKLVQSKPVTETENTLKRTAGSDDRTVKPFEPGQRNPRRCGEFRICPGFFRVDRHTGSPLQRTNVRSLE